MFNTWLNPASLFFHCPNNSFTQASNTSSPLSFIYMCPSFPASAEAMSASSSSLMRSSLLCNSWTKCPLSVFISITRPTSCLRVTPCTSAGQSGLLSTSSGLWPHRDRAFFRPPASTSSIWSTVCRRPRWSAWVSTGMMCPTAPSPNSSTVARIAWATSWSIPLLDPGARITSRKACGPGPASWRLLRASLALLLFPCEGPKRSGVSITVTSLPSITVLLLVLSIWGPMGVLVSLLPNKVSAREVRPPPAGPRRISLRAGLLGLLLVGSIFDSSAPSLDDPAEKVFIK